VFANHHDIELPVGMPEASLNGFESGSAPRREALPAIVIVGAGPVGLTAALRLASLGVPCAVMEANPALVKRGSKALCIQHGALRILDLMGCADDLLAEGVTWSISRTFVRDHELFHTHFPSPPGDPLPAFLNIPQFRTEQVLLEHVRRTGLVTELWQHTVVGIRQDDARVVIEADTPNGRRHYECEYLIGCDGLRSAVRDALGVAWHGYSHADRFLIADIRTEVNFPRERRFYFDARSNPGRQIVVHAQPGKMWRFDWQLPPDSDVEVEQRSGKLDERIRALTGDIPYEIDWLSTYRFHQRCAARMRIGRVFLAGDAAHAMPPFGARGMNSGIQDIDNLAWKLALVRDGIAAGSLLDSYEIERRAAAHENLAITESTIRFMVPPTRWHRMWRDTALSLGRYYPPLAALVNSGQMSRPNRYPTSPIVTAPRGPRLQRARDPQPGSLLIDAPCRVGGAATRLRALASQHFIGLYFCADVGRAAELGRAQIAAAPPAATFRLYLVPPVGQRIDVPAAPPLAVLDDFTGALNGAYSDRHPTFYLIRPDGYIAARVSNLAHAEIAALIQRSAGISGVVDPRPAERPGQLPRHGDDPRPPVRSAHVVR
jgi:2-polyprenyl-6-methoxyphenol hydroxylase-like FAD-dependent oxidoreductase